MGRCWYKVGVTWQTYNLSLRKVLWLKIKRRYTCWNPLSANFYEYSQIYRMGRGGKRWWRHLTRPWPMAMNNMWVIFGTDTLFLPLFLSMLGPFWSISTLCYAKNTNKCKITFWLKIFLPFPLSVSTPSQPGYQATTICATLQWANMIKPSKDSMK